MGYIEKQLQDKTKDISFIELKEDSSISNKSIDLRSIPLPILTNSLIEEVKSNKGEEISLKKVVDGISYLLGIGDNDFPYIDDYKLVIKELSPNIEANLLFKAIDAFKEEDIETSLINIRALLSLNENNIKGLFQYAIVLETIGKELLEKTEAQEIQEGEEVLKLSTSTFEKILDIDEEYSLAYYKLGYHYKYHSQYIKSSLIWEKCLKFSDDELLKKEIREEISYIQDEVNFETAITYISYSEYKKALDALLKLLPSHKESWNVNYLLGQSYKNLGDLEQAIDYLNQAINYNSEEADLYNELGALYYNVGDQAKAIEVFTEGIKHSSSDYKLIFNRSLMYSNLGDFKNALIDAESAFELNDDDNIRSQIKWLKENIDIS